MMLIIHAIATNVEMSMNKLPMVASMLTTSIGTSSPLCISSLLGVSRYCQYLNVPFFDDFVDFIFREF